MAVLTLRVAVTPPSQVTDKSLVKMSTFHWANWSTNHVEPPELMTMNCHLTSLFITGIYVGLSITVQQSLSLPSTEQVLSNQRVLSGGTGKHTSSGTGSKHPQTLLHRGTTGS